MASVCNQNPNKYVYFSFILTLLLILLVELGYSLPLNQISTVASHKSYPYFNSLLLIAGYFFNHHLNTIINRGELLQINNWILLHN